MFRQRKSAQKPDEEFIIRFQQIYRDIVTGRSSDHGPFFNPSEAEKCYVTPEGLNKDNGVVLGDNRSTFFGDQAPKTMLDFNFSPSWPSSTSTDLMPFTSQNPNFHAPKLEWENAFIHSPAHDLHAPALGLTLMTPISLSRSIPGSMEDSNEQYVSKPTGGDINSLIQQESYAPSVFVNREPGSGTMDVVWDSRSPYELPCNPAPRVPNVIDTKVSSKAFIEGMPNSEGEKLRYITTLQAPTAIVAKERNAPVSYLNKGQVYKIIVVDPTPMIRSDLIQYRTFVRISFDDEEQKSNAATCWQLWKEGRGLRELRQRGRPVFAVEYVGQHREGSDDHDQLQIQVEQKSFDGFCITWAAHAVAGTSKCGILVRFNFLSTDFTRSKGVKGLPVRLCAKTQALSLGEDVGICQR